MRRSIWLVAMGAVVALAVGQSAVAAETAQQTKMTTCNADAKTQALTGDARRAFMKKCLSGQPAAVTEKKGNSQQEKMKACNTQAPTGAAHKAFMKECLSSHPAAAAPAVPAAPAAPMAPAAPAAPGAKTH
jgi:psiF repeat